MGAVARETFGECRTRVTEMEIGQAEDGEFFSTITIRMGDEEYLLRIDEGDLVIGYEEPAPPPRYWWRCRECGMLNVEGRAYCRLCFTPRPPVQIRYGIERAAEGIKCDCGGYAERVKCTREELRAYNCGRSWECCARAFVCCVCGVRIVGAAEAPEME